MSEERSIELEVEVPGTPEEVWEAIATGPGISSWYVPHNVEEREGGAASASFGPGPEMQIAGKVVAWDPPRRVVFGTADGSSFAFEWLVEARDRGTCVVRLVNSGFGSGDEWDAQYDAMTEGWQLFLMNLRLHLTHFKGRRAVSALPTLPWSGTRAEAWRRLTAALGWPEQPAAGARVETPAGAPPLGGTVIESQPCRLALLLDAPAPGTAFLAAEHMGDACGVSVWSYLYDLDADAADAEYRAWMAWLGDHAAT